MNCIDVLAFAPHPDDAELGCAGTLLQFKRLGKTIGIVDLSHGELSTRGNPSVRSEEIAAASRILQLDARENAGFPDGSIANTPKNREIVIRLLRRLRPSIVFLPYTRDRHPDHEHASELVREACFYSGLEKIPTESDGDPQQRHRPARLFYYMLSQDFIPTFIVGISDVFEQKMQAVLAYRSQFFIGNASSSERDTYISTSSYMDSLTSRAKRLGFLIGETYGEGFEPLQPLHLSAASFI